MIRDCRRGRGASARIYARPPAALLFSTALNAEALHRLYATLPVPPPQVAQQRIWKSFDGEQARGVARVRGGAQRYAYARHYASKRRHHAFAAAMLQECYIRSAPAMRVMFRARERRQSAQVEGGDGSGVRQQGGAAPAAAASPAARPHTRRAARYV